MKKYFIFAALVTAGLLTSCSSSDDIAVNDTPVIPTIEETDFVPIKIGVSQYGTITRGTGTVGGVVKPTGEAVENDGTENTADAFKNWWKGQTVNVYMFKSHADGVALNTLQIAQFSKDNTTYEDIYNNAVLTTPVDETTGEALYLTPKDGETGVSPAWEDTNHPEHWVKYYPMVDRYSFWGYRVDDAKDPADFDAQAADPAANWTAAGAAPEPTLTSGDTELSTTIWVNGTQDVLSGVTVAPKLANLTATQIAAVEAFANHNPVTGTCTQTELDDFMAAKAYSASAARGDFQPELKFSHMMTRLTFDAYAGSADAGKYTEIGGTTADKFDEGEDTYQGVYVTGIKVRPISNAASDPITYLDPTQGTFKIAGVGTGFTAPSLTWATTTTAPVPFELKKRPAAAETGKELENSQLVALISGADPNTNGAVKLADTDKNHRSAIGEAIIAPSASAYEIEFTFCQKLVTIEDDTHDAKVEENYQFNSIKTVVYATEKVKTDAEIDDTKDAFQPGFSYNFRIKVYGLERIEISTTLNPWTYGGGIDVDTDN